MAKKTALRSGGLLFIIILLTYSSICSQDATLLPDSLISEIIHQVSGERAWWHVHSLAQYHRIQPSNDYHQAAIYVEDKAKQYGLEDVKIETFVADGKTMNFTFRTRPAWDAEKGELWIIEPVTMKIADYDEIRVSLATYSREAQVISELIYVGSGESASDYAAKDVRGKLVLASGNPGTVHNLAVFERGALGVLSYYTIAWQKTRQPGDYPDQVSWGRIEPESDDGQQSTFAFMLSYRNGNMLRAMLDRGDKVVLKVDIKAKVYAGHYEIVTGRIPGQKYPDQEFVFVAHLDHYRPGANDNASGSAVLLEIARSLQGMIAEKIIKPPLRTLRFLWVPEINGLVPYLANRPAVLEKTAGVINMDMVGAKQCEAKAIFILTRTPNSLPSYFADVIQNFTEYARDVNREPSGRNETLKIIAPTGTRDNFDVEIAAYGGGSDHYVFVDGAIRIPAVMFGTWPDVFYHTNEDKPAKVDPTTLKRATFLGVAAAIYFTHATDKDVPRLAMEVMSKARARIAQDEKKAYDILSASQPNKLAVHYKEAKNIIHQAVIREREAILSCSYFADGNKDILKYLEQTSKEFLKAENASHDRLKNYYHYLCQAAGIKPVEPTATNQEKQLSNIIPQRVMEYKGPLGDNFLQQKLGKTFAEEQLLIYKELPKDYAAFAEILFETLNFVDGKRSITDIRNAVSAEYYPVSLAAVEEYLKVLEKAGVVR